MSTRLLIECLVKIGLFLAGLIGAVAYLVLVERKMAAWIQDRLGPNRVGIPLTRIRLFGLGQPVADGVKFIFKEEFTPGHVDKFLYWLAPAALFVAAMSVFAVIPFGHVLPPIAGGDEIPLVIAPGVDVGMVYVFAIGSIGVYGVLLGSWASNNKYSFFGGLRSGAQLISYELPLGLGLLGVVLASGSLRLDRIILDQAQSGVWNVMVQPLGFLVFAVAACAEASRLPFDLPEAEQELVGGYHTEYSGMKLMMYLVAEYTHMVTASFLIVILYLGGWHFWWLSGSVAASGSEPVSWLVALLRVGILLGKVGAMILVFMIVRWSWPRFRFDQLMSLAWKVMLPLGLVNVVVVATWVEYASGAAAPDWLKRGFLGAISWVALLVSWLAVAWFNPTATDNRPLRWDQAEDEASPAAVVP
jgi:NADH-quinone oxidoreductase subunit H